MVSSSSLVQHLHAHANIPTKWTIDSNDVRIEFNITLLSPPYTYVLGPDQEQLFYLARIKQTCKQASLGQLWTTSDG